MSKRIEVIVTQARAGLKVSYKAGQRVALPAHKAESAVANKWARYAEPKAKQKPEAKAKKPAPAAAKRVPVSLSTVSAVLDYFEGDADKMREHAKEHGIYIHSATKKTETIAGKIAEANSQ